MEFNETADMLNANNTYNETFGNDNDTQALLKTTINTMNDTNLDNTQKNITENEITLMNQSRSSTGSSASSKKPFTLPIFIHLIWALLGILMLVFSIIDKPEQCGVGLLILVLGIPVYYIWIDKNRKNVEVSEWWIMFTERVLVFLDCALEEHLMADHSRLFSDKDNNEEDDQESENPEPKEKRNKDYLDPKVAERVLSPYSVVGVALCSPI